MNRKYLPLVLTGVLACMSLLLEVYVYFPVMPAAPFLLYSPGDLPIIVAAIMVGPFAGASAAFVNATLFAVLTGQGGPWGAFMHFVASGGMALVIGWLWKKSRKLHFSMLAGIVTRVALMVPLNLLVTPIYTGAPRAVVIGMLIPVIIPFNLIHAGLNTILSFALLRALPDRVALRVSGRSLR